MRQLTDSEQEALRQARVVWLGEIDVVNKRMSESFEAGFTAGLDHAAAQLAALTAERDGLRALVRRVKAMGDRLSDDEIYNRLADAYENGQSLELIQLLTDCQEALK